MCLLSLTRTIYILRCALSPIFHRRLLYILDVVLNPALVVRNHPVLFLTIATNIIAHDGSYDVLVVVLVEGVHQGGSRIDGRGIVKQRVLSLRWDLRPPLIPSDEAGTHTADEQGFVVVFDEVLEPGDDEILLTLIVVAPLF